MCEILSAYQFPSGNFDRFNVKRLDEIRLEQGVSIPFREFRSF